MHKAPDYNCASDNQNQSHYQSSNKKSRAPITQALKLRATSATASLCEVDEGPAPPLVRDEAAAVMLAFIVNCSGNVELAVIAATSNVGTSVKVGCAVTDAVAFVAPGTSSSLSLPLGPEISWMLESTALKMV